MSFWSDLVDDVKAGATGAIDKSKQRVRDGYDYLTGGSTKEKYVQQVVDKSFSEQKNANVGPRPLPPRPPLVNSLPPASNNESSGSGHSGINVGVMVGVASLLVSVISLVVKK